MDFISKYPINYWTHRNGHTPMYHIADDGFGNLVNVSAEFQLYNFNLRYIPKEEH